MSINNTYFKAFPKPVPLLDQGKGPLPWALLLKALHHTRVRAHTHPTSRTYDVSVIWDLGLNSIQRNFKLKRLLLWPAPLRTHGNASTHHLLYVLKVKGDHTQMA